MNTPRLLQLAVLVASMLMPAGCRTGGPAAVNDSQLNWMSIKYSPLPDSAYAPCTIDIFGTGLIRYNEGRSPLVANDFATDVDDKRWGEHFHDEIGGTPGEARRLLQAFVDAGATGRAGRGDVTDAAATNGIVFYRARINGEQSARVTGSPKLVAPVERLVDFIRGGRGFK